MKTFFLTLLLWTYTKADIPTAEPTMFPTWGADTISNSSACDNAGYYYSVKDNSIKPDPMYTYLSYMKVGQTLCSQLGKDRGPTHSSVTGTFFSAFAGSNTPCKWISNQCLLQTNNATCYRRQRVSGCTYDQPDFIKNDGERIKRGKKCTTAILNSEYTLLASVNEPIDVNRVEDFAECTNSNFGTCDGKKGQLERNCSGDFRPTALWTALPTKDCKHSYHYSIDGTHFYATQNILNGNGNCESEGDTCTTRVEFCVQRTEGFDDDEDTTEVDEDYCTQLGRVWMPYNSKVSTIFNNSFSPLDLDLNSPIRYGYCLLEEEETAYSCNRARYTWVTLKVPCFESKTIYRFGSYTSGKMFTMLPHTVQISPL